MVRLPGYQAAQDWFRRALTLVANQSERQLGAFFYFYLLETQRSPQNPPMVDFRNKVIHKGYIPSSSEALSYANYVHDYIAGIVEQMNKDSGEFVMAVHADERKRITGEKHNSNMSVKHYIPFARSFTKYYRTSLEEKMQKRKSYRWLLPGTGPIRSQEQVNGVTGAAIVIARQKAPTAALAAGNMPLMVADASDLEAE